MILTDMQQLFDYQNAMDEQAQTLVQETLAAHPERAGDESTDAKPSPDLNHRPVKLMNPNHVGDCEDCGSAAFTVRDSKDGRTYPMCRMCINAIHRQSLQHTQYGDKEICWQCEITVDSLGIISGATHRTKPVEDEVKADGSVRQGIGPMLRAGRVDLTDGVLSILPSQDAT